MKRIVVLLLLCIIAATAQSLALTNPNGGEQWIVGNKHPIHWDWTGTISTVRIDYSTDGGTNWILIASSSQNDGDYLWTIPSGVAPTCFLRIADASNPAIFDISDGSFAIDRQTIDIRTPDGGEVLTIGEYQPIHWDWTGQFANVKIEYSTNAGSLWTTLIASTANDGEHYWQVPDAASALCRVRVTNTIDPECYGTSNANFTIAQNTITVLRPNGGEAYTIGQAYPIYWDWTGTFANAKIEYSTDAGATWQVIANTTPNDGSYLWTIPNAPTDACAIRVSNTTDASCQDVSDDDFTILATGLEIVAPNGGESFVVGDIASIGWNWTGTIASVRLDYSTDGGGTWNQISPSTSNDGDHSWTIPNIPTTQGRLRVTNLADPNCWDASDADFTVLSPTFTIFDPGGGQQWVAGECYPIHWNWRGTAGSVKLELWYKTQTGVQWWTIASTTPNDGSHYFTVPYYISDSCGIKLTSNDDASCYDLSEVFEIVRPTISVIYPNGGEGLIEGDTFEIIWESNGDFGTVMLQSSMDGGQNWQTITASTTNDGTYPWEVPSGAWDTCLVKVINTADIQCFDASDQAFDIIDDTIRVIRPAAGDTVFIRHKYPVRWTWAGGFATAQVRYSTNGGGSWSIATMSTLNNGFYTWTCDTFVSDSALVRVISNLNTGTFDNSDLFFIADTASLAGVAARVLTPIAGDTFAIGAKCGITWHSDTFAAPHQVNLCYRNGASGPWINIATVSATSRSYEWTAPNYVTDSCQIMVADVNGSDSALSDLMSLRLQRIKILSPTAAKEWIVGDKYYILWKWTGGFANAVLDYSYDGGFSWVNIASPTPNDGAYEWTIPNAPSANCLLRIRNYENANVEAISEVFTIKSQQLSVTYPIAADSFYVGRKYYVTWDYTGAFTTVDIDYSIDAGANWIAVATNVPNNQRYEWTIPNTPTAQARVRIRNSANIDALGMSQVFRILPQTITVTAPELNDEWLINRKYYVTWWHTGVFNTVKLEYSYDGGSIWNTIADNVTNNLAYEWTIPNTPSDNCLVKVSNYANLSVYDLSEQFRIPLQTITITSPLAGEAWISGRKYFISWRWTGTIATVNLRYSTDAGATWNDIALGASNTGSYEWTVPTLASNDARVRVESAQNASVYAISGAFSFQPQQITITSPVEDDTLLAGRSYYITWRTKGSFSNADLWYSLNGGSSWTVLATGVSNAGYYEWDLPEATAEYAVVRVANSAQSSVQARSDTFVLAAPLVEITSPVEGNLWVTTRKYYITWNQLGVMQQVNLAYSLDGGGAWNQIVANQTNQGNYEWTIPTGIASQNARVRVVSSANGDIQYVSDSFVISATGIADAAGYPVPAVFMFDGCRPNPFRGQTEILFGLPTASYVRLSLYDAAGRLIERIVDGDRAAGYHVMEYRRPLSAGVYFLRIEADVGGVERRCQAVKILRL